MRRRIPSILPGPRERPPANTEELSREEDTGSSPEPWVESRRGRREGKMQADKKVRESGMEGWRGVGRTRGVKK